MVAHYKVMSFGAATSVAGATGTVHIAIAGVAKCADASMPYVVANEYFCNAIARALTLPCPPGAITQHNGLPYFFSLDFNLAGQALPPILPATVVAEKPRDAWGVIAFDALLLNTDRHRHNLAYDAPTKRLQMFDHSHALLGPSGDISARLTAAAGDLTIGGHCLAQEISTDEGRNLWTGRIASLPDYLFEVTADDACEIGLPSQNRDDLVKFLLDRRGALAGLLQNSKAAFPKLP